MGNLPLDAEVSIKLQGQYSHGASSRTFLLREILAMRDIALLIRVTNQDSNPNSDDFQLESITITAAVDNGQGGIGAGEPFHVIGATERAYKTVYDHGENLCVPLSLALLICYKDLQSTKQS